MKLFVAGFVAFAALGANPVSAAPPELLTLAPAIAASNPAGLGDVVSRGRPARFNAEQVLGLVPGAEVELTLPDGTRVPYVLDLKQDHGGGIRTWIGRHRDRGNANRAIVTTGPGGSFGVFETPQGEFRLVPGRNGTDVLIDMKAEAANIPAIELGDDHHVPVPGGKSAHAIPQGTPPQPFMPLPGVNTAAQPKAAPTPVYDLDLLIIYSAALAQHLRGNLMTRLYFIVDRLNTAYADSEAAIRLRLVHTIPTDYPEGGADTTALYAVSPQCATAACGAPYDSARFGDVENQRTTYGADLALFARDGSEFAGSGISWIGYSTYRPAMYSVVTGCVLACEWVFMHELGHQMGLMHDRPTVEWQGGGTPNPAPGKFSYSYGYAYCSTGTLRCDPTKPPSSGGCVGEPECSVFDSSNFSDVMAYFSGSAFRNVRFSNPDNTCFGSNGVGHACGVPAGQPQEADGALSINNYRVDLAATTSTTVPDPMPGSVQFSTPYYAGIPSSGPVTLQVTRLGGTGGALQVNYRTVDGSAHAGTDYTAATGTLSWADGDGTPKTIAIELTNPSASDTRTFTVELFGASGAGPMDMTYPSTATVFVVAPWPVGSNVPEGFQQIGNWDVGSDFAFEGTTSVRSPVTRASVDGQYVTWALSFQGNFSAGSIAFAYRVSDFGYPYAYFHFFVDGQEVMRDSGESGWQLFAYPLAAGSHFLSWQLATEVKTPCSQLAGSPGGANCADRLWLDSFVVPPFTPTNPSGISITSTPNPSTAGQNVSFTATVGGSAGTPTGSVTFLDGGATMAGCASLSLAGASATCVTSSLGAGTHSITASYAGDAYYVGSTGGPLQQTVNAGVTKVDPSVALTASANPIIQGQPVTFTATVSGNNGGPTGTVTFTDGSMTLCGSVAVANGTAACAANALAVGTHSIVATYSGDGAYNAAASTALTETVNAAKVDPSVALASSANPIIAGQSATFSATVTGGNGAATGTVTFTDGSMTLCDMVALSGGAASCTATSLAAGTHSIIASYSGDGAYNAAASAALNEVVQAASVTLALSPASLDFGPESMNTSSAPQSITLTNNGNVATTIGSITTAAPFGQTNDCGSLAPGASCTISVTFSPAVADGALNASTPVSGTLTVNAQDDSASAPLSGTAEKSLVTHYYRSILRRAPDTGGHDFWASEAARVAGLGANVNETWFAMAMSFFGSTEYAGFARNDAGYLTDIYNTFFNRAPDADGFNFWMGQLAGGMPREAVLVQFLFSPEFANFTHAIFGAAAVRPEMDMTMDMYRGILERLPDSDGFGFFLGQFRAAQCSGADAVRAEANTVSQQFFTSPEYANLERSNAQYMSDIYNAIMRRGADLDGIRFWIGQLDSGALAREQVRAQFVQSPEFNNRVTNVIDAGCVH